MLFCFVILQLGHALGCVVNRSLHNGNVPITLGAANAATVALAYQLNLFFFLTGKRVLSTLQPITR